MDRLEIPALVGSQRQIEWASDIRQTTLDRMDQAIAKIKTGGINFKTDRILIINGAEEVIKKIRQIEAAHWWIENRHRLSDLDSLDTDDDKVFSLANAILATVVLHGETLTPSHHYSDEDCSWAEQYALPIDFSHPEPETPIQDAEPKEPPLSPPNPISPLPAKLGIQENQLHLVFPEKNHDLIEVARRYRMKWAGTYWCYKCGARSTPPVHAAAELASMLLKAGFIVQIEDPETRRLTIEGSYEPRQWRWICLHLDTGLICFETAPDDDLDYEISSLPGARWHKEFHRRLVPTAAYEAIEDFAEEYKFNITNAARQALDMARETAKHNIEVNPTVKLPPSLKSSTEIPELSPPTDMEIDSDLADDGEVENVLYDKN